MYSAAIAVKWNLWTRRRRCSATSSRRPTSAWPPTSSRPPSRRLRRGRNSKPPKRSSIKKKKRVGREQGEIKNIVLSTELRASQTPAAPPSKEVRAEPGFDPRVGGQSAQPRCGRNLRARLFEAALA